MILPKLNAVLSLVGGMGTQKISADGINTEIILHDGQTMPAEEDIQAKLVSLKAEQDATAYARNRKLEYDALNQFELISDDTKNGTTTHIDAIAVIKAKYPKPK